ncbi:hypothetical protein C8R47DRAFT_1202913 [Mycena vitilis]|nr:hypothetical protein C8R47DRAFT_1202913 [Mycena vitilis]
MPLLKTGRAKRSFDRPRGGSAVGHRDNNMPPIVAHSDDGWESLLDAGRENHRHCKGVCSHHVFVLSLFPVFSLPASMTHSTSSMSCAARLGWTSALSRNGTPLQAILDLQPRCRIYLRGLERRGLFTLPDSRSLVHTPQNTETMPSRIQVQQRQTQWHCRIDVQTILPCSNRTPERNNSPSKVRPIQHVSNDLVFRVSVVTVCVCLRLHCPPADEILEASEWHTISRLLDCGGHSRRRRRPTFYSFSQRTGVGTRAGWGLEWKMKLGI